MNNNTKNYAIILILITFSKTILAQNAQTQINCHVMTDEGKPLTNMICQAGSFVLNPLNPADRSKDVEAKTDQNGDVILTLPSTFGEVNIGIPYGTSGYYNGNIKYQFKKIIDGKWQPWNPKIDVVVKPIIKPIPMYAQNMGVAGSNLILPAKNAPIGFDLEVGDWVAPYGKGTTADFIFTFSDKNSTNNNQKPATIALNLSFSNKGDGIQSVIASLNNGSALRLPRFAPAGGYEPTLVMGKGYQYSHGMLREDQNYFFRVRTVIDSSGKVQSALYGKIAGPIQFWDNAGIEFTYYLNPTPNDRNMEFDPSKNLFQNLDILQQVKAP